MTPDQLEITGALGAELAANDEGQKPDADRELARELLSVAPGFHYDLPEAIYHARVLGFASKSALDLVRKSAGHYHAWVTGKATRRETPALRLGKAVHCAALEPERFARDYVLAPKFGDCRYLKNKNARDAFAAEFKDATILRDDEGALVMGMIRAAAGTPFIAELFEGSRVEVTARWDDLEGLACKARADIDNREILTLADVKSAEDASLDAFERAIGNYGYHRQADWYRRGWARLGVPIEHFVFVVLEKTPPHFPSLYELTDETLERGRQENDALIARLLRAIERDEWPAYPAEIQRASLPRYMAAKELLPR